MIEVIACECHCGWLNCKLWDRAVMKAHIIMGLRFTEWFYIVVLYIQKLQTSIRPGKPCMHLMDNVIAGEINDICDPIWENQPFGTFNDFAIALILLE